MKFLSILQNDRQQQSRADESATATDQVWCSSVELVCESWKMSHSFMGLIKLNITVKYKVLSNLRVECLLHTNYDSNQNTTDDS